MCSRFTFTNIDANFIAGQLGLPLDAVPAEGMAPRYNIAPTDPHWIMRARGEDAELVPARWGLVNYWAKDRKRAAQQINARAEGLLERAAFREAFLQRRCIIPADGFYEWTGPKEDRRPYWFHRSNGGLLLLPGLYESWRPSQDERERTFAIITVPANELMAPIHDRMPALLDRDAADAWLHAGDDPAVLMAMLTPPPESTLMTTAVSKRANSVRNDDPSCLKPVADIQPPLDMFGDARK